MPFSTTAALGESLFAPLFSLLLLFCTLYMSYESISSCIPYLIYPTVLNFSEVQSETLVVIRLKYAQSVLSAVNPKLTRPNRVNITLGPQIVFFTIHTKYLELLEKK